MGLWKRLLTFVALVALVGSVAGTALAGFGPEGAQAAAQRMYDLQVLSGRATNPDGTMNSALTAAITRAELVVKAYGRADDAKLLSGAAPCPGVTHHGSSGYVAVARNIIEEVRNGQETIGLPDGSFNPDGNVTAAAAVAFLMKFLGVQRDTTLSWPMDYLQGAVNAGVVGGEDHPPFSGPGHRLPPRDPGIPRRRPDVRVRQEAARASYKLTGHDGRTVHWKPVALPDGSGYIYGDTATSRLVVQPWTAPDLECVRMGQLPWQAVDLGAPVLVEVVH